MFSNEINVLELNIKASHMHRNNCRKHKSNRNYLLNKRNVDELELKESMLRLNESISMLFRYVNEKVIEYNTNTVDSVNENRI